MGSLSESQKRPFRLSSPTINLGMSGPPVKHVPRCHMCYTMYSYVLYMFIYAVGIGCSVPQSGDTVHHLEPIYRAKHLLHLQFIPMQI